MCHTVSGLPSLVDFLSLMDFNVFSNENLRISSQKLSLNSPYMHLIFHIMHIVFPYVYLKPHGQLLASQVFYVNEDWQPCCLAL